MDAALDAELNQHISIMKEENMGKGNKPVKNDKANMKPKKASVK